MSFNLGHVDDCDKSKFKMHIYSDEKLVKTVTQNPEEPVEYYNVKIGNADIIKITWETEGYTKFGIANIKVSRV